MDERTDAGIRVDIRPAAGKSVVEELYTLCGCTNDQIDRQFIRRACEAIRLFSAKQRAYGLKNIAEGGELGLANRTNEKVKRLQNLLTLRVVSGTTPDQHTVVAPPQDNGESRRDSWIDIGVQGLMGTMVFDGDWPGAKNLRMVELP